MIKGYCHVYTGEGKGKTTAAFGLAVRAACAGKQVYICQFIKDMAYSETRVTQFIEGITIDQMGCGCMITRQPNDQDIMAAERALEKCHEHLTNGQFDMVIMDEVNVAISLGLLKTEQVLENVKDRNPSVEVILTGRGATEGLIQYADLVTEMKEVKHYYQQGVLARKGIEC